MRVLVRSGLRTILDGPIAIAGAARPPRQLDLQVMRTGAALVRGGASPGLAAERAVAAGARAVLLYGLRAPLPAGGLGLDESAAVPIVSVRNEVARAVLEGDGATVTLGNVESVPNAARGTVASFSSAGLAYDARVKPELVAPGVGLATADPGASRFVTVNGSSAAAAVVAGAAALVVQARPTLSAGALKAVLVGTSRPLARTPVAAQGAGLVNAGRAVASELAAAPAALALGRITGPVWSAENTFTLTNLSKRALTVRLHAVSQQEGAAQIGLRIMPSRAALRAGQRIVVHVHATLASTLLGRAQTDGAIVARVAGAGQTRIPWSVPFELATPGLIGSATLSDKEFAASDEAPTLLSVDAGRVLADAGYLEIRPVRRLDIALAYADGTPVGLLVRVRDLLPGRYAFAITGRGPDGKLLAPGKYLLTISAYPVGDGLPSVTQLPFSLR
ncbi:MAG TPA: S8 family serine peptidase, partial [Gaiellaceae bacterium]|nr:S8 family serine peptidase [Gaiellaceae bacterium]